MKILFISNLFGRYARGGAERVVEERMREAHARGHEVVLVTGKPLFSAPVVSRHPDYIGTGAFCVYSFFPLNLFFYTNLSRHGALVRALWHCIDGCNVVAALRVWWILFRERPDEVHTHNMKGIGLLAPCAIRAWRVRWVHTVHDVQLITPSGFILYGKEQSWQHRNVLTRMYRIWCRAVCASPHEVRFPSLWCKQFYEQYGFFKHSKKIIARNSVPISTRHVMAEGHECVFMYVGQIESHKGVATLVEAFRDLPCAQLHIYGSGAMEAALKIRAQDAHNIHFHGRVSQEELQKAYANRNVLVYPSLCYENAPMSIIEAKAHGLAIIASRIGGIPELLDSHDVMIAPGDVALLRATIVQTQKSL